MKWLCNCDEVINLTVQPNRHKYLVISEVDFDQIDSADNDESLNVIHRASARMIRCASCDQLYIFSSDGEGKVASYGRVGSVDS